MKKLYLVGLGPGDEKYMTGEALSAIGESETIVGYPVYLDLIKDRLTGKTQRSTPMRNEAERCEIALKTAAGGVTTALVCSGDAGVYGMSGLIYEMAADYPGVEIVSVSGITAALSGAGLLGAPLMNDFAVISLSDLLTPWADIERRLEGAGAGDFVICLYNPGSKKRTAHLARACEILLKHRPPGTVCGLAYSIGREEEDSELTTLGALKERSVDMFTTVFIGNSKTENIDGRMVVRRGYRHD
jgi:precorrin-3B C17-methyltransferase